MNVFITGGSGLLGSALLRKAPENIKVFTNYHENKLVPIVSDCTFSKLDIRNKKEIVNLFKKIKPDVIIHTAAKSSPDFCEFNQDEAWDINVEGTRNILHAGKAVEAKVIFTSSNQVFSGKNPPYSEKSRMDPVNFYGKTKVQSEKDVLKNKNTIVARLMTMYGWNNPSGQKNTATWVIDALTKKQQIKVVDDVFNNFLWVDQAAEALWKLAFNKNDLRLVNVAGVEVANRFDFACKVADTFSLNKKLITPVKKSYFKEEAPRPLNTIYNITLYRKKININPLSLNQGLKEMKEVKGGIKWKIVDE